MSKLTLYSTEISPPCRAVLMTASVLGIDLDIHEINLWNKDTLKEDFVKLNPQHIIPTIVDNDFVLWDSHAIITYLVEKYASDDSLYPKDLQKRAVINQRLHFDSGILFNVLRITCRPVLLGRETTIPQERLDSIDEAFTFLDKFLEGKKWLVGDSYTLADISCVTSISSLTVFLPVDKYTNVQAWLKRCQECIPGYDKTNAPGNKIFHDAVKKAIQKASVLMTAHTLGVPLLTRDVNIISGEQRSADYLKKNPQGTVPLLQHKDYFIWDSHAISGYLVHEYAKNDALYPLDSRKRALVDQRLHFDTGILYPEFRNIVYPVIYGRNTITKEKIKHVESSYRLVDSFLKNSNTVWLAGETMTIADICNVATLSTLELFIPSIQKFPLLNEWLLRCKTEIPGYEEINQRGLDRLAKFVKELLTK